MLIDAYGIWSPILPQRPEDGALFFFFCMITFQRGVLEKDIPVV